MLTPEIGSRADRLVLEHPARLGRIQKEPIGLDGRCFALSSSTLAGASIKAYPQGSQAPLGHSFLLLLVSLFSYTLYLFISVTI